jgi:hypothetical protein
VFWEIEHFLNLKSSFETWWDSLLNRAIKVDLNIFASVKQGHERVKVRLNSIHSVSFMAGVDWDQKALVTFDTKKGNFLGHFVWEIVKYLIYGLKQAINLSVTLIYLDFGDGEKAIFIVLALLEVFQDFGGFFLLFI